MMTVWKIIGKIIRSVLCCVVYMAVHTHTHTQAVLTVGFGLGLGLAFCLFFAF